MTIYGGKNAKLYFGEYEIDYITSLTFKEQKRNYVEKDYKGKIYRYTLKPEITGQIDSWDVGLQTILNFFKYREINSDNKLVAKYPENNSFSIGFPLVEKSNTYLTVYNGQSRTMNLDLPSEAVSGNEGITFKKIAVYIDGVGTPNNATYTLSLYEDTTLRDSDTWLWSVNDARWVVLENIDYTTSNYSNFKLTISTSDTGTAGNNCQRIYAYDLGTYTYPYISDNVVWCSNIIIRNWQSNEQSFNLKVEIENGYTAYLYGVVFGSLEKNYSAGGIDGESIPFTAERIEWVKE